MKNLILTLVVLFSSYAFSQTIDWQKLENINTTLITAPIKNRDFAGFKIENINKFLYKVEISGKGFNLETPIPTELQTLFRLTVDEKKALAVNEKADKATEDIKKENEAMASIKNKINAKPAAGNGSATPAELQLSIKIADLNRKCADYYSKATALSTALFKLKILKVDLINIAQMDESPTNIKAKTQVSTPVTSPEIIYQDFINLYSQVEILYEDAENLATDDKVKKIITTAIEKIEESFEVFKDENILNLYNEISFLQQELNNDNNYIAKAPPIQMTSDFIEYKCKITPTKTNTYGAYKSSKEISFIIPNKGGVKVDFSVGPTVSVGQGSKDEKYFLEESTTVGKSYLRQRNNNNAGLPGLAAMMHVYDRGVKEAAFGGLFGVGAGFQSIEDVDLNFYLGASVVLGKMQKVMINTGFSFQRVNRLKDKEFVVGKEYTTQDFDLNNVVEKVFKPSLFIGLSYSLAKRVEN